MRETYLNRKHNERTARWRSLNRKRKRKRRLPAVLSYREQQCVDADNRMRYHAIRIKGLGTTL